MTVRMIKTSWWVDFRFNHTRYRKRSPENSRTGALSYEAALRQKLARGEQIGREENTARSDEQFERFAWRWFDEYVVANNKRSEQEAKKKILRSSLLPFFGNMTIKQITGQHIEQYKAKALKEGVSRKTINNRLTVLRKFLTTAYEWLALREAPPKIMWLKCPPPKTDYLTPDDCSLLLSPADGVIYEMILTALRTGMRQGELRGLQWESIDWQNRSVVVRHSRCDYTKKLDSPKSNRERHIPLDADVHDMLFRRKRHTGYVFLDADHHVFDSQRLARRLAKFCEGVGMRKIGWHTFRHTFASHLVMRGVPLAVVQLLMGHATINMTMRYTHLAPSTLRAAIDLLNPQQMPATNHTLGQPVGNQPIMRQFRAVAEKEISSYAAKENAPFERVSD